MKEDEEVPKYRSNHLPRFLKWVYILLPLWGILWFYLFWNGSEPGFFNRDYWSQLQKAANTKIHYNEI